MPTTSLPNDWLLLTGRIGAILLRAVLWLGMAALLIGLIYVGVGDATDFSKLTAELQSEGIGASGRIVLALIFGIILVLLALYERLVQQLQRVIESVGAGDPFSPQNALRIERMGWFLLATQLIGALAMTVTAIQALSEEWDFAGEFSVEGLFMVVLLFILARVFKHGAAMRDDLEGTV